MLYFGIKVSHIFLLLLTDANVFRCCIVLVCYEHEVAMSEHGLLPVAYCYFSRAGFIFCSKCLGINKLFFRMHCLVETRFVHRGVVVLLLIILSRVILGVGFHETSVLLVSCSNTRYCASHVARRYRAFNAHAYTFFLLGIVSTKYPCCPKGKKCFDDFGSPAIPEFELFVTPFSRCTGRKFSSSMVSKHANDQNFLGIPWKLARPR